MAGRKFAELRFHSTYYFASVIRNVLNDQFEFLTSLHDFYGDDEYLAYVKPFQRTSALHWFIRFIVDAIVCDDMAAVDIDEMKGIVERFAGISSAISNMRLNQLPIEDQLRGNNVEYDSFLVFLSRRSNAVEVDYTVYTLVITVNK